MGVVELNCQGLLVTNPDKRMTVSDIRRHPWFLGEAVRTSLSRELNFGAGSRGSGVVGAMVCPFVAGSKGCEVSSCDRCKTWAFGGADPTDPTSEFGVGPLGLFVGSDGVVIRLTRTC